MKFGGDSQELGFFLGHVLTYMQEYGPDISTQCAKVRCVTLALEGAAAECKTGRPAKKTSPNPVGKPTKVQPWAKEMVLEGVEVVQFTPSPKRAEGILTPPDNGQE